MKKIIFPLLAGIMFFAMIGCGGILFAQEHEEQKEELMKNPEVILHTNYGDMRIMLYNETPKHRDNFLKLAKESYYDSTLFHRVISGFMIQGGDPDSKNAGKNTRLGAGGPGYTIPAEFRKELIHKKGALAAARQGDRFNPQKRSSGSQFYIVVGRKWTADEIDMIEQQKGFKYTDEQREIYMTFGGYPFLDREYTVYGEVVEGLDVVVAISVVDTNPADRPLEDVIIESVEIVE
ncbi:MAG TPA: peptidylprolyl isomerase [Candidatus Cloacimonetes bacterium]|nr:peptidylprolyl isomerase [Candidatus Cloacimonadota bacterium]